MKNCVSICARGRIGSERKRASLDCLEKRQNLDLSLRIPSGELPLEKTLDPLQSADLCVPGPFFTLQFLLSNSVLELNSYSSCSDPPFSSRSSSLPVLFSRFPVSSRFLSLPRFFSCVSPSPLPVFADAGRSCSFECAGMLRQQYTRRDLFSSFSFYFCMHRASATARTQRPDERAGGRGSPQKQPGFFLLQTARDRGNEGRRRKGKAGRRPCASGKLFPLRINWKIFFPRRRLLPLHRK